MPSIGPLELIIVLIILLVIFGPKRLPGLGRSLGTGMKEFKDSITGNKNDHDDDERPALEPAPAATSATTPPQATSADRQDEPVAEPRR